MKKLFLLSAISLLLSCENEKSIKVFDYVQESDSETAQISKGGPHESDLQIGDGINIATGQKKERVYLIYQVIFNLLHLI